MLPLLVILAAGVAGPPLPACAGLRIEGNLTVKQHRFVRLTAAGHDADAALDWTIDREADVDLVEVGDQLLFVAPPGEYVVTCTALKIDGKRLSKSKCRVRVIIEGNPAKPPPAAPPAKPAHQTKEEAERALCRLRVGSSGCTATVIGPRRADGKWDILTAAHCWGAAVTTGTVTLQDGRTLKVRRVAIDRNADICWMVTEDPVESLPHAWLSPAVPEKGSACWHAGWGVDRPRNTERGTVSGPVDRNGQLPMHLSVSSGDSGGGIFRSDTNQVISCVCCTRAKGAAAPMWGGACTVASAMRPKG